LKTRRPQGGGAPGFTLVHPQRAPLGSYGDDGAMAAKLQVRPAPVALTGEFDHLPVAFGAREGLPGIRNANRGMVRVQFRSGQQPPRYFNASFSSPRHASARRPSGTVAISNSDEFADLAERAKRKANSASGTTAKRLREAVATEWPEAENSPHEGGARASAIGPGPR
jgi:hypothetical protein